VDSPCYDAVHTRDVVFVAGEYWLVADHLTAPTRHDYAHRLHLTAPAEDRTVVEMRDLDVVVRAPAVDLVYPAGTALAVEPGWVAPVYGTRHPAPVVCAEHHRVADAEFVVLLWPRRAGVDPPRLTVHRPSPDVVVVQVAGVGTHGAATDHVAWAGASRRLRCGPITVTGQAAWVRVDRDGRPERTAVYEGEDLTWTGPGPAPDPAPAGDGWSLAPRDG
jgi:hypothetical protein